MFPNDSPSTQQDTNWARKREHLEAGAKLNNLHTDWIDLVRKNYEVLFTYTTCCILFFYYV